MRKNNAESKLKIIKRYFDGEYRVSQRKVPYLILPGGNYSVCWFGRLRIYRTFSGFGTKNNQVYKDFKTHIELVNHFRRELNIAIITS